MIELILKEGNNTIKITFESATYTLSGNFIIITHNDEKNHNKLISRVFNLNEIDSFRTNNK